MEENEIVENKTNQSADSTVWTCFNGFQLLFVILCGCLSAAPTNILLQTRMSRFTHSMFNFMILCQFHYVQQSQTERIHVYPLLIEGMT